MKPLDIKSIKEFIKENNIDLSLDIEIKQLRSLITAYCLLNDIDVDTFAWDMLIAQTYESLKENKTTVNQDCYDNLMCHNLV